MPQKKIIIPTGNALMGLPPILLSTLGGGELEHAWQQNLQTVLDNIRDERTEAEKKREINIKITLEPVFNRDQANVRAEVSTKLAGFRKVSTILFVGAGKQGRATVTENDPKQPDFFNEGADVEENDDDKVYDQ